MDEVKLASFKEKLQALQIEIEASVVSLKERALPVSPDVSLGRLTRQEALQEQNVAKENLRQAELRLKRVQGALHRIHNKTFGECMDCGDDIAPNRLEIIPENALCIACATEHSL